MVLKGHVTFHKGSPFLLFWFEIKYEAVIHRQCTSSVHIPVPQMPNMCPMTVELVGFGPVTCKLVLQLLHGVSLSCQPYWVTSGFEEWWQLEWWFIHLWMNNNLLLSGGPTMAPFIPSCVCWDLGFWPWLLIFLTWEWEFVSRPNALMKFSVSLRKGSLSVRIQ